MRLTVRYFAGLREAVGRDQEQIEIPAEVLTVADLREHLEHGGVRALGELKNLRAAVNLAMATPQTTLGDGDEVAFFPPVTGG